MIYSFRTYFVHSMPYRPLEPHSDYVNSHCLYNTFCLTALIAPRDAYDFYMFGTQFNRSYNQLRDILLNPPNYNHAIFVKAFGGEGGYGHSFSIICFRGVYSTYESNYLRQVPTMELSDVDIILNKLHMLRLEYLEWFTYPIPTPQRLNEAYDDITNGTWAKKYITNPWQL